MANYITQLKRSGYFQQVEIKESHQDESNKAVEIFHVHLDGAIWSAAIRRRARQSGCTELTCRWRACPSQRKAGNI